MKQEVIQDFLNLPGIEGIALVNGQSRPYFCGLDQSLDFQQKRALAQGIQQVIETTPTTYDFFQFQFSEYQVYVHKLPRGLILLVLASNKLGYATYIKTVKLLTVELTKDTSNAIANFQTVASQTVVSQQYSSLSTKSQTIPTRNPNPVLPPNVNETIPRSPSSLTTNQPNQQDFSSPPPSPPPLDTPIVSVPSASPATHESVLVQDFLGAIDVLLNLTVDYLGKTMVSNYWKASRPPVEWLSNFELERLNVTIANPKQVQHNALLTPEQQKWLREWVAAFVQRCARIIRDFPKLVHHLELNSHQKMLLFQRASLDA